MRAQDAGIVYWAVAALTGVSISFAPLFLYRCGKGGFPEASWWLVPACFAVTYLVPLWYIRLACEVIASINRQIGTPGIRMLPKITGAVGRFIGRAWGRKEAVSGESYPGIQLATPRQPGDFLGCASCALSRAAWAISLRPRPHQ
jgi:hypothetical protein